MPGNDPYKNFDFNVDIDGKPVIPDPPPKKEPATAKRTGGFFEKLRDWLGLSPR